jgi:imidazolonepropionase-like amidohydrolase
VTVVDVARGRRVAGQTVVVRGDRIAAVGPRARVRVPADARVVDGRGRYVIPGLWDMGSLVLQGVRTDAPGALALMLAHGVTGTRDLNTGMPLDSAARLAGELERGARVGPRLVWTGPALQQSIPAASPNFARVDSLPDALALLGAMADAGAHHVRLVQGFRERDVPAVVAAARARGLPVTIAPVFAWDSAVALGVAGIEHFVDLRRTTARRPWRDRYAALYRDGAPRPPREAVQPFLDSLGLFPDTAFRRRALAAVARAGVPVTTNMATMFWARAMLADRYPARARLVRPEAPPPPAPGAAASREAAEAAWRDLRALRDAGVPLLAGSLGGQGLAAVPGAALHDELELMVRGGLTPREALAAATVTPAAVVARLYPRVRAAGAVAAGQPADLVVLDADPLADVANVRRVRAVVARGRLLDRAALDGLLDEAARLVRPAGQVDSAGANRRDAAPRLPPSPSATPSTPRGSPPPEPIARTTVSRPVAVRIAVPLLLVAGCAGRPTPAAAPAPSPAERVVQAQLDAYNRHDLEAFAATYAPDARGYVYPDRPMFSGGAELRATYGRFFAAAPAVRARVVRRIAQGDHVIDHEEVTGMPDGSTARAVAIYEVRAGRIASVRFVR